MRRREFSDFSLRNRNRSIYGAGLVFLHAPAYF